MSRVSLFLFLLFLLGACSEPAGDQVNPNTSPPRTRSGAELYNTFCAACHGITGHGDGPASVALARKPFNFTNKAEMAKRTDADLERVIANGVPPSMPAWGGMLSAEERQNVVTYLREFAK